MKLTELIKHLQELKAQGYGDLEVCVNIKDGHGAPILLYLSDSDITCEVNSSTDEPMIFIDTSF